MALIRLCYAADLPGPEEALKALRDGRAAAARRPAAPRPAGGGGGSAAARRRPRARMAPQPRRRASAAAAPQSFEDVVALIDARRDIALKLDVEKYLRPISFRPGAIAFEPAPGAPANLAAAAVGAAEGMDRPALAGGGRGRRRGRDGRERQKREERAVGRGRRRPLRAYGDGGFPGRRDSSASANWPRRSRP